MNRKKTLVSILSVSALAFAMLPTTFAFADASVTDTVEVTVPANCTFSATDKTATATIANGVANSAIATRNLTFSCNNALGWNISAVGASSGTKTSMTPSGSGTAIVTGTATSGETSNWAFKVAGSNASYISITSGYTAFHAIPSTATTIATNNSTNKTVSSGHLTPTYQVYISPTQQADTYTGKVTYTLTAKTS